MISILIATFAAAVALPHSPAHRSQTIKTDDAPAFSRAGQDLPLAERFLRSRHVKFVVAGNLGGHIVIIEDKQHVDVSSLLAAFKEEFGVDLRGRKDGAVVLPFPRTTAPGAFLTVEEALSQSWAPGSLLVRAVRKACKLGLITTSDRIVSCTYLLRPWLTDDLRLTECLQGDMTVQRGANQVTAWLRSEGSGSISDR